VQSVIEKWMQLSNRYSFSPPEEAAGDEKWPDRIKTVGMQIGAIRKQILQGNHMQAHDLVLALQGTLGTFFEGVTLPKNQRLFLKISGAFSRIKSNIGQRHLPVLQKEISDLRKDVLEFEPLLNDQTKPAFLHAQESLYSLERCIFPDENLASDTLALAEKAEADFIELRSRLLMAEWFSVKD